MIKLEYSKIQNCELKYLQELNLLNENFTYTKEYEKLNRAWNTFRRSNPQLNFLPKKIRKIIIAPYSMLANYFMRFDKFINRNYPLDDYKDKKNPKYIELKEKKKEFLESLLKIFNYDIYVKKENIIKGEIGPFEDEIANFFKKYSNDLNIFSCYYCDSAIIGSYDDKKHRTFDIDHFFPKAGYPVFALSLYNFVPSCQVCNSRIKNQKFIGFYYLKNIQDWKKVLKNNLSPVSNFYDFNQNVQIQVQPIYKDGSNISCYGQNFSNNYDLYKISFDCNYPYNYVEQAFRLEKRYNMTAIKKQALYLEDLKLKYPEERILQIVEILNQNNENVTYEEIEEAIFHKKNRNKILNKLFDDILK